MFKECVNRSRIVLLDFFSSAGHCLCFGAALPDAGSLVQLVRIRVAPIGMLGGAFGCAEKCATSLENG